MLLYTYKENGFITKLLPYNIAIIPPSAIYIAVQFKILEWMRKYLPQEEQ